MMTRFALTFCAFGVLAACQPAIPDSGVGFDNSVLAQNRRDAALSAGAAIPQAPSVAESSLASAGFDDGSAEATAAETARVLAATRTPASDTAAANSGVEPVQASPSNPAPQQYGSAGISDENSFEAVSGRETIQSDKARIAANRAQYEVIEPEALPSRSETGQPNIVAYALKSRNPRGQQIYPRRGFNLESKSVRNCAQFASPDQAQIDFLARGGPERDRKALDPDGDGYACDWDPTPFRRATEG